jgi:hypothetical protein
MVPAAGARARTAFLENYDLPRGVARFCSLLGASKAGGDFMPEQVGVAVSAPDRALEID